jgi:hypothetical protein
MTVRTALILSIVIALIGHDRLSAQEGFKPPAPAKEHAWLTQLAGEWDYDSEAVIAPGQPPLKAKGTESVRSIGGFWIMLENKGTVAGQPFTGILTLGYDPAKKKFVGTWIDSMNSHMVVYDNATLDSSGKLTLNAEMPNPMLGGKLTKFKDVLAVKSKDEKTLTSAMLGEDGKWTTFLTVKYQRKK